MSICKQLNHAIDIVVTELAQIICAENVSVITVECLIFTRTLLREFRKAP